MKRRIYILMAFFLTVNFAAAQCNYFPVISSYYPTKGHVGDTISIYGSGFGFPFVCLNNVDVFFGATKATIICSTSDSITVKVPAEAIYAPITVMNACGRIAVSKLPFDVTFCPTLIDSTSFNTVSFTSPSSGGYHLLSLDFDLDGHADIINCGFLSNKISIYKNNASTPGIFNFAAPIEIILPGATRSIVPADFNNDGLIDLAVVYDGDSSGIAFYMNSSNPGIIYFLLPVYKILNVEAYQLAAGDFNNDGKMDIAFSEGNYIKTYINNSTNISFSFSANYIVDNGAFATGIVIADVNNDAKMDIATSCGLTNNIKVIVNTTTSLNSIFNFIDPGSSATFSTNGEYPYRLVAGDFDRDGKIDLATNNYGDVCGIVTNCNVAIFRNTTPLTGSISFSRTNLISPSHNYRIGLADADGDGDVDIFTKSICGNKFSIYVNESSGSGQIAFEPRIDYTGASEMSGIVIADFDNDSKPDYVTSGILYNTLNIHRNLSKEKLPQCRYDETKHTSDSAFTWSFNNITYHTSGNYTDSFLNDCGCYCLGTLKLYIDQPTSTSLAVSAGTAAFVNINNISYTQSGTYNQLYTNASGIQNNLTLTVTFPAGDNPLFSSCGCDTASNTLGIATNPAEEEIYKFTLNGQNAGSNYIGSNSCFSVAPGGSILKQYSNFKSSVCLATIGQSSNSFEIQVNKCDGANFHNFKAGIWIDFNDNHSFEAAEKVYASETLLAPATINSNFNFSGYTGTIPGNLTAANLRVIVARDTNSLLPIDPNVNYDYGETEDYCVTINNSPAQTVPVNNESTYAGCVSVLVNVGILNAPWPQSANSYQWFNECEPIIGATNSTYSGTYTNSANIHCVITNAVTSAVVTATPYAVTVFPNPVLTTYSAPVNACLGTPVTLSVTGAVNYLWMPGSLTGSSVAVSPTSSTIYTITGTNSFDCTNTSTETVTIIPCNVVVNLKCYIQGYYQGAGLMNPVLFNQGELFTPTACDTIEVQLRSKVAPFALVASVRAMLHQDGTATCIFPGISNDEYYLTVLHRSGLQTWSASPIVVGSNPIFYNFSNLSTQAYGSNQSEVDPGIWAFYSGDLNSDENIDLGDFALMELDINNFIFGYFNTDINGDGNVDLLDVPLLEINNNMFIFSNHP